MGRCDYFLIRGTSASSLPHLSLPRQRPENLGEARVIAQCMLIASRNRSAAGAAQERDVFRTQSRNGIDLAVRRFHHYLAKRGIVSINNSLELDQLFFAH